MDDKQDEARCAWALKRSCTVAPRQFVASSLVVLSGSLLIALFFTLLGFWIISLFFVVEMIGVCAALLWFARHAIDGERIWLYDDGRLVVEVVDGSHRTRHHLNAAWAHLHAGGPQARQLWLSHGSLKLNLGRHVRPADRLAFHQEFRRHQRETGSVPH